MKKSKLAHRRTPKPRAIKIFRIQNIPRRRWGIRDGSAFRRFLQLKRRKGYFSTAHNSPKPTNSSLLMPFDEDFTPRPPTGCRQGYLDDRGWVFCLFAAPKPQLPSANLSNRLLYSALKMKGAGQCSTISLAVEASASVFRSQLSGGVSVVYGSTIRRQSLPIAPKAFTD